ncbi:MAG: sterol desaturase family protein [Deltaproteobacteria bacterium]|nr:sterol desaturase family protein [Deltaproteobacteria bacterium]
MTVETAGLLRFAFVWGGFGAFLVFELLAPYRPSTVSKPGRWVTNLSLTAFNGLLMNLAFSTALLGTTAYVAEHRVGVLALLDPPEWVRLVTAVAFMDFMLYVWHLLNHEMPLLWRFHRVHHSDLNMDVSTATRFHIGELSISAALKIALVFFLGLRLVELVVFELLLVLCAQFQHSVVRVPGWFERAFWAFFVPPSMHRIHHSVVIRERNTNYGTIFSVWDRFLGTLLTGVNQSGIRIGMGAYPDLETLGLGRLLAMPFTRPVP